MLSTVGDWPSRFLRAWHTGVDAARDIESAIIAAWRRVVPFPRRSGSPRMLIVDEMVPDPRLGAGYPRAAAIVRAILDAGWDVTLAPLWATRGQVSATRAMFGDRVRLVDTRGPRGLSRLVRTSVGAFDAVLVSRPNVIEAFDNALEKTPAFRERTALIHDAEALTAAREEARRGLFGPPMTRAEAEALLVDQIAASRRADVVLAVSEFEASAYRSHDISSVHVVSHRIAMALVTPEHTQRKDLLFVGRAMGERWRSPNVDSLMWFVDEVLPLLGSRCLRIAGVADDALVARLASAHVEFCGIVDDLTPLYDACRAFVAPTRYAAGIPLKVLDAMAAGIPCIVTPCLAAQLDLIDGHTALVADEPARFAAHCSRLLEDDALWTRLRDNARAHVARRFAAVAFDVAVQRVLAACLTRQGTPAPQVSQRDAVARPAAFRIAIDVRPLSGTPCGYTVYLCSIIACLKRGGFEITLLSNRPLMPEYDEAADLGLRVFGNIDSFKWEQIDLPRQLVSLSPDVYFSGANQGVPFRKSVGTRYVLGLLDVIPYLFFSAYYLKNWSAWMRSRALKKETASQLISIFRSDAILTISQQSLVDIKKLFPWKNVTACLIRLKDMTVDRSADPKAQFVYVGGMDFRKKLDVLLDAFAVFVKTHADYRLVLIGAHYAAAAPKIEALGLGGHIQVTGFVDHDTKSRLIGESLALIYPSLYEGYGMAIAEGLQAGIPVIAGTGGSQRQIGGSAIRAVDPRSARDILEAMEEMTDPLTRRGWIAKGVAQLAYLTNPLLERQLVAYFVEQANRARGDTAASNSAASRSPA